MNLSKLLLLIVSALLVYWVLKAYGKTLSKPGENRDTAAEDMVRCAHCGVNLPMSESLNSHGDFFCSKEHLRAHSGNK
jgi:uncharacterized protein